MFILRKLMKENKVKRITSSLKPLLTEEQRNKRFDFCKSFIDPQTKIFCDMLNRIHIDEKLFYLKKEKGKYYLVDGERVPLRVTKSKRFIPKIMFLCAVARPRWDSRKNQKWDGKIGIWPLATKKPAVRASRNRPAGTMETKPQLVTRNVIRDMLIGKVLPAIVEKWPESMRYHPLQIQQDNARPHIAANDKDWVDAVAATGMDVQLVNQPPNSPDLNVLDLGLFSAIQARQYKKIPSASMN
ncbi:MAG: hypothetical protein GY822_30295 [Deltaproteobacteria bacterium]|nr:hypothetical protein [Deltaproteobacteria bacterium]